MSKKEKKKMEAEAAAAKSHRGGAREIPGLGAPGVRVRRRAGTGHWRRMCADLRCAPSCVLLALLKQAQRQLERGGLRGQGGGEI